MRTGELGLLADRVDHVVDEAQQITKVPAAPGREPIHDGELLEVLGRDALCERVDDGVEARRVELAGVVEHPDHGQELQLAAEARGDLRGPSDHEGRDRVDQVQAWRAKIASLLDERAGPGILKFGAALGLVQLAGRTLLCAVEDQDQLLALGGGGLGRTREQGEHVLA